MKVLDPMEDTFHRTESTMSKLIKTQKLNSTMVVKVNKQKLQEQKQNKMIMEVNRHFIGNLYKLQKYQQKMKDEEI